MGFQAVSSSISMPRLLGLLLLLSVFFSPAAAAAVKAAEEEKVEAVEEETPSHTPDEVKEAKQEFIEIDADGDGYFTEQEILAMEEVPEREEINEFFETYDLDKNGQVSFEQILKADETFRTEHELPEQEPPE